MLITRNSVRSLVSGVDTLPSTNQYTLQSILSPISPQINPVSSYQLRCSLVQNPYSIPDDVLTTFNTAGTTTGQLVSYQPNEFCWVDVPNGSYHANDRKSRGEVCQAQGHQYADLRHPRGIRPSRRGQIRPHSQSRYILSRSLQVSKAPISSLFKPTLYDL
jgi:hypothetical protein